MAREIDQFGFRAFEFTKEEIAALHNPKQNWEPQAKKAADKAWDRFNAHTRREHRNFMRRERRAIKSL